MDLCSLTAQEQPVPDASTLWLIYPRPLLLPESSNLFQPVIELLPADSSESERKFPLRLRR